MSDDNDDALLIIEKDIKDNIGFHNASLVVREISRISRQMPDSVIAIPASRAKELAGSFLKGLDLCGELAAIASAYEAKMQVLKNAEHATAMLIRSQAYNCKTAKEKEAYADSDADFLKASEKHIKAKMFRTIIENKREDFEKAHYLMRRLAEEDREHGHTDSPSDPDEARWDSFESLNKRTPL